ncbi:MAG: PKD domain-containing protein [Bacteroidales bacterium]|nr:PKD domain-containing protein [Bacteroidales bacterium]
MKKFMIFLLMTVLLIGTSQARSEAAHFKNAGLKLPSWISQGSHSFFTDAESVNTINVFVVGPTHACQTDIVTLTAMVSGYEGSTALSYQWRLNGQAIPGATSATYAFSVADLPQLSPDTLAYDFDVYVWADGCEATYSAVHYFNVSPTPVILVDVPVVCDGEQALVTATAYTSGDEQPYMWIWTNGGTQDTTYVNTHLFAEGNYSVAALYQDFSCNVPATEFTVTDSVQTLTDLSITPATAVTVCEGALVSYTVTDPNAANYDATYAWYLDGALIPEVTGLTYAFNTDGEGAHTIKVVATYLCDSKEVSATFNVLPTPSVVIVGENAICNGDQAHLTASVLPATPTTGDYTFAWSPAGGSAQTADVAAGTYTVTVTDPNSGCAVIAEPFTVTEFGTDVVLTASEQVICEGESVVLNANTDGWSGDVTYEWNTGETTSSIVVAPTTTATYTVTATLNGESNCTVVRNITVTVNPKPAAPVFKTTAFNICENGQATIEIETPVAGAHYTWYLNGIEVPGENLPTITLNFLYAGTYTVNAAVVNANGCVSDLATAPAVVTVKPAPSLVQVSGDNVICQGTDATLTASVLPTTLTDVTYTWSDGTTGATLTTNVAGVYTVTAAANGCEAATEFTVYTFGTDIQVTASSTDVCAGEAVVLNVNADGWADNITYAWSDGTNTTSSTTTVYPTATTTYTVTTTLTNSNGATCERVDEITITVHEAPAAPVFTAGAAAVCHDEFVRMDTNAISAGHWYQYTEDHTLYVEQCFTADGVPGPESGLTFIPYEDCVSILTAPQHKFHAWIPGDTIFTPVIQQVCETNTSIPEYICQGDMITLTANSANADHYIWYHNGIEIAGENLETLSMSLDEVGQHQFAVRAVSADGCPSELSAYTIVTVEAAPSNLAITGANTICQGELATIVASAEGADSYLWSTTATNDTIEVGSGVYSVIASSEHGCTSASETFTVNSVGADLIIVASATGICAGENVTLTANAQQWTGYVSYEWSAGVNDADANTVNVTPTTTTTYTVTATSTTETGTCTTTRDITITVFETPATPTVTILDDDNIICEGAQATIKATTTATDPYTYIWYENGIEIPGHNLDTIVVSPSAGSYDYKVKVISVNGCSSAVASEAATLTVRPNPTIEIMGDPLVCDTTALTLIANVNDSTGTGAYPNESFDWRIYNYSVGPEFPNPQADNQVQEITTTGNLFETSQLTAQDDPYVITVSLTNDNGCVATSDPFYLYVGENPTVAVTTDFDTICPNGEITATAHLGDYNMDNIVYQWYTIIDNDTVAIPYGTSPSVTISLPATAELYVEVTQTTTECFATGSDSVVVIAPPQISNILVINDGHLAENVCEGAEITVTAYLTDPETGESYIDSSLTYVWYENGFLMPLVDGPRFSKQLTIVDEDMTHYTYQAFINYGMPGCEAVPVASATVEVKRNPIVIIDGVHHICFQGVDQPNVHLTAWVDGGTDLDATYRWYKNGMLTNNDLTFLNLYNEMVEPTYQDPYIYMVEVINGDGCTSFSDPFEVNIHDIPYVNVTASETEICEGGSVEVRANLDDYNESMLTFQWFENELNNDHIMPGYTHEFQTFTPEVTTDYIVQVLHLLNDNTNEYSVCAAYDTITIVVNDIPVVDSITTNLTDGNELCEGAQFTLTAHISGGVAGGEVYTWYRNGEIIEGATGATYTDSPVAVDGDVTVYNYTVSVAQTASGCQSEVFTTPVAITINPNPTLAIETDPIVCVETADNITLIAHIDPTPATPYSFTWYEDNAIIASNNDGTLTITRPYRDYGYNFSVSTVNEYGCHATASTVVYVNDNPVVNIEVTEDTICDGGEITLTANLNDWNADELVYQWFDNGNLIHGATSLTYTVVPTVGTHKYTFEVEQLTSGCEAASDTLEVIVNNDPVITSITTDLTDGNVLCEGAQFTLTAHVDGGVTGGEIFTWYRNGEIVEGATGATLTDSPVAVDGDVTVYNYTVAVAQTAAGCGSAVFATPVAITINPNPTLAIETDPIVCVATENNITMIAHIDPTPATPFTYTWYEDNAIIASNNDGTLTITRPYRDYGYNFSVSTVNEYGCVVSASTVVYVNDNPVVNTTVTENNICEGGEITMTANLNDWNADELVYQWFDNGNLIHGATSLSYTVVPTVGSHAYTFTVEQLTSGCTATSEALEVTVHNDPVIDNVTLSTYVACQGAQVEITANVADYDASLGTPVFTWYRNGILMEGANAQTIYDSPVTVDNNTQQFIYTAVVTLTASGCQSAEASSAALTIYPNPTVQITGDQHICVTMPVFLAANVDTIGTDVGNLHYTWYESGQIRDNMAYQLGDNQFYQEYFYARTEPYRFRVNVERDGVPAGCASMSDEFLVWVYEQPVVNITATETEICTNGEVTLTANLNDYNATNITYQWYEIREQQDSMAIGYTNDGDYVWYVYNSTYHYDIPGATSATYTTNYAETTHMGVRVIQTPSQCFDSDSIIITVNPIPVVTDITVNNEHAIVVCNGAQVTVAATIDPADAEGAVYTWYRNGELIEGATQASFSENVYTTPNHITTNFYTAIVTLPASGCVSEISAMAGIVTINPAPTTVTISGNNVICENDSTTLTAYSDVEGTWTWSTGSHDSTITVPAGVYTVTMTTAEGCEMTSEPFAVEALGTDVFVTASATSICRGEHTTLYVNQDGWAGNVSYQWDAQAGNSISTTVDVQPDSTTTYHVTATVSSTNGSCTAEGEITIIVNQLPEQVVVTPSTTTICEAQQITFNASGNATGYIWYQNGVEIPGENQAQLTVNFNEAGQYTFAAKAINEEGCVSAIASEPVTVTVNPAPSTVSITGNNVICENDVTVLTAYSDVEGTWTWSTGSHDSTITVPAGVYTVTMTTPEGCEMTSEPFAVEALGTQLFVTASATAICEGEHTTLYATQDGWAGNVTFQWDSAANNSTANTVDVTPTETTTYHVTATVSSTNGTCTAVGEITIIVTPRPGQVVVTATTADTICEGEQVTLHASGNAAGYIWYQNGVEIPGENQADLTVNFYNEGVYTFAAKAINEEGCVSALASEPYTIVVNSAPESVVISGQLTICDGGSTTLYADVTPNVAATYVWYKDGVVIAGETNSSLVVYTAGSYRVDATTNGCTTSSEAVVVTVEQAPELQLTATEYTICEDGTTVITAEATGWNNADVTYSWSNGFVGSSYTFNPTAAGDYQFIVTASQATSGCVATDTINIHVDATPATPVIDVNFTEICDGGQVIMTVTNDYSAYGTPVYTWYRNGQIIAGATLATLTDSPIAVDGDVTTYTYNATVTFDASGCTSANSANTVVTVLPTPVVAVSVTGNTTICEGGSTTLNANVTPAGSYYTYQWYVDNVMIAGATDATLTVSPAARETAYNYHVVVTAAPGCIVTSENTAITVVADPVVVASVDNAITCVGGTATFTATVDGGVASVNGLNGYTFAWYNNISSTEPIATTPSYTTTGDEAADAYSYWVVVTSPYGCQTTSNIVNYTVVADPTVTVAVAQGYPTTVCDGGVTTLIANVTGGYGAPSYQWYKNGIALYGQTNPTLVTDPINYNETADYTVVVTQTGVGCEATSAAYNVDVVPSYTVDVTGYDNVCVGGTVTMTAQVNGVIAGDNLTYQWYTINNGTQTAIYGATAPQYTTSPLLIAGAYEYFVVVTSSISGCSVTQSYSVNANVIADPTVQIVANGSAVICDGGNITLNAVVNGGVNDGAYVYTWSWFGAASGSAVTTTPSYQPQLAANDPANPYYFTVSIARADNSGCEATSAAFQVNVLAAPSVQITADHSYVCAGGEVTFTANVAEAGSSYNYVWTINGETQAVNSNTITVSMPNAGDITASVTVSNTNSSVSCSSTATLSVPVHVVADPVVTIAANHTTMCAGGTTTLSVQNITADSNIPADYSYQWAINGMEIPGAINSTFVQPLTDAGTYVYTLKVTQNGNLGCASAWSAPVTVQVAEQPVVTLNSDYGLDICEGGDITLTGTVTNFGNTVNGVLNSSIYGNMTFNWLSNGISTDIHTPVTTAQDQYTDTLNTVGNYNYQVVVTPSGYACQPATSNIQTVNVVSSPSWTDIHVLYPDVCVNSVVYLEAGIQGGVFDHAGSTNGQIQWTVTYNGVTSNVSGGLGGNSYDLPTEPGDYIYTPTWIGNIGSGCAFTNTAEAQTFVTVHELPTASFDSTSYGQTICGNVSDASAALVINFTGTAPFTFQLQDLETGIILPAQVSGTNTYTVNVAPGHTTQYRIIMVSDQYCENGMLDNADAIITVFVNDIEFDQTMFISGCDDNGMVTINFNMISGTPNSNFVVTYANGDTYTGTIDDNTATFQAPTAPGDYPAVFTVDGCDYDIVVRVLVGDYSFGGLYPIMDQRWHDVVVVNNNPETNGGHTFVGFQWYKNGILIPGAIYSNYQEIGGLNGFYSVELIEQAADGSMVTYQTCEFYFSSASSVRAYPVPANINQEITLELDLSEAEMDGAVLDIYNVTGSLISHVTNLEPITKISGFKAQGTYFGRILTGTNEIKTVKFVIVK